MLNVSALFFVARAYTGEATSLFCSYAGVLMGDDIVF